MATALEQRIGGPNSTKALKEKGLSAPGDISFLRKIGIRVATQNGWEHRLISVNPYTITHYQDGEPLDRVTVFRPLKKELKALEGKTWEIFKAGEQDIDGKKPTQSISSVINEINANHIPTDEEIAALAMRKKVNNQIEAIIKPFADEQDERTQIIEALVKKQNAEAKVIFAPFEQEQQAKEDGRDIAKEQLQRVMDKASQELMTDDELRFRWDDIVSL